MWQTQAFGTSETIPDFGIWEVKYIIMELENGFYQLYQIKNRNEFMIHHQSETQLILSAFNILDHRLTNKLRKYERALKVKWKHQVYAYILNVLIFIIKFLLENPSTV